MMRGRRRKSSFRQTTPPSCPPSRGGGSGRPGRKRPSKLGRRARRPGPPFTHHPTPPTACIGGTGPRLAAVAPHFQSLQSGAGMCKLAGASERARKILLRRPFDPFDAARGSMRPTSTHVGLHNPRRGVRHRWVRNRSKSPQAPSRRLRALRSENKAQVQGQEAVPVPGVGPYGG